MNLKKITPVLQEKDKKDVDDIVQIAHIYITEATKSKLYQKKIF